MSEKLDRRARDFSKFDSMTTEQLQQILRLDAMKPTGEESDTEELFYIMEVLADRRRNDTTFTGKTTQQAFEEFQKYYMPEDAQSDSADAVPAKQNKISVRWFRRISAIAAALAIVLLTTVTADAFGYDLFGKIANWSEDFFHFEEQGGATEVTEPDVQDELEYASLQEALDINGITQRLAPAWLPERFSLSDLEITESPKEVTINANYRSENDEIVISIRQLLTGLPIEVEKNDNLVEVCYSNGIAYYIFQNTDAVQVSWIIDEFECIIIGEVTVEEMKEIVKSI